uniref:Variant surface glycoprotein n=1 Tax=Trypanosoma brucei TaxID=5691 RepID=S5G490_9TRYP|nr:variant surface glycoprotein [Trypanosoma brucei]
MMIYLFLAGMMVSCAMHTQAAEDPAAAAIKTPCEADIYLEAIAGHLRKRLTSNADAAEELSGQARRLHLASVATQDETKSCLLGAIAVAAAKKAAAVEDDSEERAHTFKLALTQIAKLRTELAAVATIAQLKLAMKNNGHRRKDTSQATHSIIQADATTPLGCVAQHKLTEGKINSLEPNPTKLLSLRIADSTKAAHGTGDNVLELAMSGSCNQSPQNYETWSSAAASCQQATITDLAPTITRSGHKATGRTEPIKTLQIYATPGDVGDCNPNHDKATEDEKPAEYAAKAICNALQTQPAAGKQLTLSGEALAADMLVVQAAGSCLPAYRGKAKLSEEEQTTLTKFLKDAYGKDSDAFNAKFTTLKPGHKVIIHKGGEVQAVDIGDIRTDGETLNAISIILAKRAAQIAATKQQTKAVDSKTEEKCKPDTEENECKKDSDCEHKDGKCKLKEGVKSENDGKPTNTTANNSFVISKTPLWLAVLLF